MEVILSRHAKEEMGRRQIPESLLGSVLNSPEQIVAEKGNRKAYQSRVEFDDGKMFLLRAIVDDNMYPPFVITVYRTSKIEKYWRKS